MANALREGGFQTRLDRAITSIAPQWGRRRLEARARIAQAALMLRRFEGASTGRRTRGWITTNGSANAETQTGLARLRARSRDLSRNNCWGRRAVRAWTSNVVGPGIVPSFQTKGSASLSDEISAAWEEWASSTAIDPEGRLSFYGMQSLGTSEIVESGEVLFRFRIRRASDGLRMPLQLQPLEADHLDDLKTGQGRGSARQIQGVEYGALGQRLAYWLFKDHPGEISYPTQLSSNRVPASNVLHVFRPDRFGQARGIPFGAPCIITLRAFDSYTDAQLMRQRIAAMFVGFVVSTDPEDLDGTVTDPGDADEQTGQQDFEPGTWEHLPLGRDVKFSNPPKVDDFGDFTTMTLRQISAGYGVPYEVLSTDLSKVNFHSGRLGRMDFNSEIDAFRRHYLIPQFCEPVLRRFLTLAVLSGRLPEQAAHASITWTPPPPRMVEPGREIRAHKDAVRAGFKTRSEVIRELGRDPAQVFAERAEEDAKLRELGINPDDTPLSEEAPDADGAEELTPEQLADILARVREGEIELEREPAT